MSDWRFSDEFESGSRGLGNTFDILTLSSCDGINDQGERQFLGANANSEARKSKFNLAQGGKVWQNNKKRPGEIDKKARI